MTMSTEQNYDELAARAERGELLVVPGTERRGVDAAGAGRRLLMDATGADTWEEAATLALGRPTLAEGRRGPSPVWRLRTTPELDRRVRHAAQERGISVSTLIREAVAEYIRPAS